MKANEMTKADLESVLLEFRLEAGIPRPGILEAYCRRYPQFARELTDYAVEWLLDEAMASEDASGESSSASSPIVSRAISHLYNGIREREARKESVAWPSNVSGRNPFQALPVLRKRAVCAQLGIDMTIFAKLQDRLIEADSVPRRFLQRLAKAVQTTVDEILGYLRLPPMVNVAADFKANGKPSVGAQKERFEDAVQSSTLDEKQKKALLKE